MKATLRIPTEQYAFMEVEVDVESIEEVREKYLELQGMAHSGDGLNPKDWNTALDRYLTENNLNEEQYNKMSKVQQYVIQEIKKSIKRLNYNKDEN